MPIDELSDKGLGWLEDECMPEEHPERAAMLAMERVEGKLGAMEAFGMADPAVEANLLGKHAVIRDQMQTSMCVGFGFTGAGHTRLRALGFNPELLSAQNLYAVTRMLGRTVKALPLEDEGSYPYLAALALYRYGFVPERMMPFDPRLVNDEPDFGDFMAGTQFRLSSFRKIGDDGEGRRLNAMRALAAGHPVPLGMNVGPIFGSYRRGLGPIVHGPRETGGHMTYLVGYRENGEIFIGANSWGKDYGDEGFYEIHESKLMHPTTSNLYNMRITDKKAA